jgi:PKHD-type hydroxylase
MNTFLIRKLLNQEQLKDIKKLIDSANENNFWQNGYESNNGASIELKKNYEISNFEILNSINSLIMSSLDNDLEFFNFTIPSKSYLNIISKTEVGGYYKTHTDSYMVGDYSTTIFLNDPNEYDGGELCLYVGNQEQKIKLNAGYAITYLTNTVHRVNMISKGTRYVSVLWTESLVRDTFIRSVCGQLRNITNVLTEDDKYSKFPENCEEALRNPKFIAENLYNSIMRRYKI